MISDKEFINFFDLIALPKLKLIDDIFSGLPPQGFPATPVLIEILEKNQSNQIIND